MQQEFIVGLTEHRTLGYLFQAFMIEKSVSFYSIVKLVKLRDIAPLNLNEEQSNLVKLIEQYSDEKLVQKFSKKNEAGKFFQQMDPDLFENHISPYLDKYLNRIIRALMTGQTRLFHKQAKYSNLYEEDVIHISKEFTHCIFCFDRTAEGTRYSLQLEHESKPLNLLRKTVTLITNTPCSLVWQNNLYLFEKLSTKKLLPFFEKETIFIPSQVEEKYYKSFVTNTLKEHTVKATGFSISESNGDRQASLSLEPNLQMESIFLPRFLYNGKEYLAGSPTEVIVSMKHTNGNYQFTKVQRNRAWEEGMLQQLKDLGLQEKDGYFFPKGTELLDTTDRLQALIKWQLKNQQQIIEAGFQLRQNLSQKRYFTGQQSLDFQIKTNKDWFDIYAKVSFGEFQIPFIKLKKYILNDIREFELPNGEIAILPKEWFTEYQDLLHFAKQEGHLLRLKRYHYQLISNQLKGIDKKFYQRLLDMGETTAEKVPVPGNIQATLRTYQHEGFSWMYRLHEQQFGGCLADDMGLGKTLQTLTLLLKIKRLKRQITIPEMDNKCGQMSLFTNNEENSEEMADASPQAATLIVMPTSLIHNWENEIQKFTPSLKVYKHFGLQRKKAGAFNGLVHYYDVILTTYGTVRNDIDLLNGHEFFYLILDESQNIKNPGSKTYQTISQLKARHRLVLTGTPIENSLSDLWAQINFINKGLLGNLAYFKREFITPIEKKNDPEKQEKLQTLIRPFILRRTKEQVARDLPPLTEQIRYCAMTGDQKQIYEKEKSAIRNRILENIEKEGVEKSSFLVLQGLTKLRQLANHPSMVTDADENESGKFDEIFRCLESLVAENHKVLIFSSFVKHLQLVKEQIEQKKWKYSILTGQTTNREQVIRSFQEDPENRIFLISLKAGGVGLNLTSADYVFIIDPWWNPAAELQAINRAHRIGQDKKVMVYRFITEESIEEKIQQLQSRKSSLAEKFINSNNPFKAITQDEILSLLN